jgi:hypothetical protein
MALNKSMEIGNTGNIVSYHKIVSARFVFNTAGEVETQIALASYKDQAARDGGKDPAMPVRSYSIPDSDGTFAETAMENAGASPRGRGYTYLKTLAEFSGATDV